MIDLRCNEEWRPIPEWDGYEVSNLGRVISRRRPNPVLLRPRVGPNGYWKVALSRGTYQVTETTVHRVVLLAFVGPCPDGLEVRHRDGDQSNNALTNLAYGTKSENVADTVAHGTHVNTRKTHCPKGHPYDERNTFRGDHGQRRCATCHRARGKSPVPTRYPRSTSGMGVTA